MPTPTPTIAEIARRAGVSKGTVSRILNGKNKENRPSIAKRAQKVRSIADALGYRPNAAARSIFSGRFNTAAFITCSDIGADYFPRLLLHGIHEELLKIDYRLAVSEVSAAALKDPRFVPQMLREQTFDAMFVYPNPSFSEHIIPFFEQQRQPTIWVNLKHPNRAVYPDDAGGSALGVQYLLDHGHRRIGYFSRPRTSLSHHYSEDDRCKGFIDAMKARKLSPKRTQLLSVGDEIPDIHAAAHALLDAFPDMTAVLCYEQEEAVVMMMTALRRGLRVPEELQIIAFHEGIIRAATGVPIPTITIPFVDVGRAAVGMLSTLLEKSEPQNVADMPSKIIPFQGVEI